MDLFHLTFYNSLVEGNLSHLSQKTRTRQDNIIQQRCVARLGSELYQIKQLLLRITKPILTDCLTIWIINITTKVVYFYLWRCMCGIKISSTHDIYAHWFNWQTYGTSYRALNGSALQQFLWVIEGAVWCDLPLCEYTETWPASLFMLIQTTSTKVQDGH